MSSACGTNYVLTGRGDERRWVVEGAAPETGGSSSNSQRSSLPGLGSNGAANWSRSQPTGEDTRRVPLPFLPPGVRNYTRPTSQAVGGSNGPSTSSRIPAASGDNRGVDRDLRSPEVLACPLGIPLASQGNNVFSASSGPAAPRVRSQRPEQGPPSFNGGGDNASKPEDAQHGGNGSDGGSDSSSTASGIVVTPPGTEGSESWDYVGTDVPPQ